MTGVYLYAITEPADQAALELRGFERALVTILPYQRIAAAVSPLAAPVEATPANLWLHEGVVEALMPTCAVLPVRFGTLLPDDARARAILEAHYHAFATALERVRGRVELGLRVLWDDDAGHPASASGGLEREDSLRSPGRQYLAARLQEERRTQAMRQRAQVLTEQIHQPLARLAVESTQKVLLTPRMLLAAAYLVDRERVDAVRAETEVLAAAFSALQFLCTGPWPPYHFVADCLSEANFSPSR